VVIAALIGLIIGFVGSMPVAGPIAVLVFGQGLQNRGRDALSLAAGAALAESVYAYLAFWGFSAFLVRYPWIELAAHVCASVVFIALGVYFYRKRNSVPRERAAAAPHKKRSFLLGLTITAMNPTLVATWTFTVTTVYSFGIVRFDARNALPFSLGALVGIVAWFSCLLYLLDRFRTSVPQLAVQRTLHVMAIVLLLVGVVIGVATTRPYVSHWFV